MASFDTIKMAIDANINTNGNQAITGAVMNAILNQMVDATESEIQNIVLKGGGVAIVDSVEKLNALDAQLGSLASLVLTTEERVSVDLYIKSVLGWQPMATVSQLNDAIKKAIESTLNTEV